MDITRKVEKYSLEKKLWCRNEKIILSLSAGKDSMALFQVMMRLRSKYDFKLMIFHLNHGMRGIESDEDELFVVNLAKKNNIKIINKMYDFSREPSSSFEEKARIVRYKMLEKIALDENADLIATAHTHSDNVETVIMRMFRGTSVWGLKGIPCKRNNIIRPLLSFSSTEIYDFLKESRIEWREDSSNTDITYSRNYVRNIVLKNVKIKYPDVEKKINIIIKNSIDCAELLSAFFSEKTEKDKDENGGEVIYENNYFSDDKFFINMLAEELHNSCLDYVSNNMLFDILKKYRTVKKTHVELFKNSNIRIRKTLFNERKAIIIEKNDGEKEIFKDQNYELDFLDQMIVSYYSFKMKMEWVDINFFNENQYNEKHLFVDPKEFKSIKIRTRKFGDRINYNNMNKKVKNVMIDKKLSPFEKKCTPLFQIENEIVAIALRFIGKGNNIVADKFKVCMDSKKILAIYRI